MVMEKSQKNILSSLWEPCNCLGLFVCGGSLTCLGNADDFFKSPL